LEAIYQNGDTVKHVNPEIKDSMLKSIDVLKYIDTDTKDLILKNILKKRKNPFSDLNKKQSKK